MKNPIWPAFFKLPFLLMILIVFQCRPTNPEEGFNQWVLWNVGQGQWITRIKNNICWHFDFGGERTPFNAVRRLCGHRANRLVLSHHDRDHFNFFRSLQQGLAQLCLFGPSWADQETAKMIPKSLAQCPSDSEEVPQLFNGKNPLSPTAKDNLRSQWVLFDHWLLTGDSPQKLERMMLPQISTPALGSVKILVLGHHGSRTSTSTELLKALPQLQTCLSSSRYGRYGHPHSETLARVKTHCSVLRTEDWNHIHFVDQ